MKKLASYILASSLCLAVALSGCGGSGGNSSNGNGGGNEAVTGNLAYVEDGFGRLDGYSIDGTTGALKPISGATYQGSNMFAAPNGKFIYCAYNSKLRTYAINTQTGILTTVGEDLVWPEYQTAVIHPKGNVAYVISKNQEKVTAYSINENGTMGTSIGSEIPLPGSKYKVSNKIAVDPKGRFACISSYKTGEALITVCSIDSTTGALTAKSPISIKESSEEEKMVFDCYTVAFDPNGDFALVNVRSITPNPLQLSNKVYTYNINSDSWQLVSNPCDAADGEMVFSSNGLVYFVSPDNKKITLASFTAADGSIKTTNVTFDEHPSSLTFDPTGKFAYVVSTFKLVCYSVDAGTGVLTKLSNTIDSAKSIVMIKR